MNEQKWHFFTVTGTEYLVLGYNPKPNNCLIICTSVLHISDQKDLEYLANTPQAQKEPYLVNILVRSPYMVGKSWWEHLVEKTFCEPLFMLKDRIAPTQYAIFHEAQRQKQQKSIKEYLKGNITVENITVETEHDNSLQTKITTDDILYGQIG